MARILAAETVDVRFPTSEQLDGSDAMNPDPDYSAAYLSLTTDAGDGLVGAGFVFTIGTGNNIAAEAIQTVADELVGESVEDLLADMGATYRRFVYDSQLRWLGPEKGVVHMAIGAVVNALWDLKAKRAGQPLWQLVSLDDAGGAGRTGRLPLPHRRPHPGRGAGDPASGRARPRGADRPAAGARIPGLHHHAGLVGLLATRRWSGSPTRRSPRGSTRSS